MACLAAGCGGGGGATYGAGGAGAGGGGGYGDPGGGGVIPPGTIVFGGAQGMAYAPADLTVKVGDTVTWSGDFALHPLSSGATCGAPDGKFGASSGTSFSFTFTQAGVYPYYCGVHCALGMKGTVTVQ